jgi:hypothetical protein
LRLSSGEERIKSKDDIFSEKKKTNSTKNDKDRKLEEEKKIRQ